MAMFPYYKQPFPAYSLQNLGARIRTAKDRLVQIQRVSELPTESIESNGIRIEFSRDPIRIEMYFPGKPSIEIRSRLKSNGFRWSPSIGAWTASDSPRNRTVATDVCNSLTLENV